MKTTTLKTGMPRTLLDNQIEPFLKHLYDTGYAKHTIRKKRTVVRAFARWAKGKNIGTDDLDGSHVTAFLERVPRNRTYHVKLERAAMRVFLEYLHPGAKLIHAPEQESGSTDGDLFQRYKDYLRQDRGLAENSVHIYAPFIRDFLAAKVAFDTVTIRDFLLAQTRNRSGEYARQLAMALRSFLHFLFLSGETQRDLSGSVPIVRRYRQAVPPAFLSPDEVDRALTAVDRFTPKGRRDYAILLLLARLGLRAGEIVSLDLKDIHWRAGKIVIRGKGGMLDRLPLLSDIGEAIAAYLREDRGVSSSRQVFLRSFAPRIGLTGPAAVGHVVRQALSRASVHRSGRGAAHLFRHSLATNMIRNGASIAEIAEILRHRSQTTTAIYAQVSFEALRTVAQPWPITGGVR